MQMEQCRWSSADGAAQMEGCNGELQMNGVDRVVDIASV